MTAKRVAPVLRALMDDLWSLAHGKKPHPKASLEGDRRVIRAASVELRVLLAVARAARTTHETYFVHGSGPLGRALARLKALSRPARVSRRGRGRR